MKEVAKNLIINILKEIRIKLIRFIFKSQYNTRNATKKLSVPRRIWASIIVIRAAWQWKRKDYPHIKKLHNIHSGKRAFVICNGPSLNKMDLSLIKDEITIGVNGLYLKFDEMGFKPKYYVIEDNLVAEDRTADINNISGPIKLFAVRLAYVLKRTKETYFLNHSPGKDPWVSEKKAFDMDMAFTRDFSLCSFGGNTVTYTCLQLAYFLGCREVYIIGADHNYAVPERYTNKDINENFVIEPEEDDVNHFHPDYFGKGYRWHNPKVHLLEKAYRNAKQYYKTHGGMVFNATLGGSLEIFERVNYYDLFKSGYNNPVFKEYLQEYNKKSYIKPFDYNGDFITFHGNNSINNKIKPAWNDSYELSFIMKSESQKIQNNKYDKNYPPMPISINPFQVYQLNSDLYSFFLDKQIRFYWRMPLDSWYKFKICSSKTEDKTSLFVNNVLINKKSGFAPLKGSVKLGKGHFNRFWKGQIAELIITGINSAEQRIILFDQRKI